MDLSDIPSQFDGPLMHFIYDYVAEEKNVYKKTTREGQITHTCATHSSIKGKIRRLCSMDN